MSNLVTHAEHELSLLTDDEPDAMQEAMNAHLLGMVRLFSDEGHSGFSAGYAINALSKLLRYEPLTPLTGGHAEWCEVADGMWQNRRCSRVFKDADGRAYDIDGKLFCEPNGTCYTGKDSRVYVTFPYSPVTERVEVSAEPTLLA